MPRNLFIVVVYIQAHCYYIIGYYLFILRYHVF